MFNIKYYHIVFILLISLYFNVSLFAGNHHKADSLLTEAKLAGEPQLVEIFNKLSEIYASESNELSFYYADSAFKIANKYKSIYGIIISLNNMAIASKNKGNYALAFNFSMKALQYSNIIREKFESARSLYIIGDIYLNQKNSKEALNKFNEAYKLFSDLKSYKGMTDALSGIGEIYLLRMNKNKAYELFNKALEYAIKIDDSARIAQSYIQLGKYYRYDFKLKTALDFFTKAETIFIELNNKRGLINTYENIGITHLINGNFSESIVNFNQSLKIADSIKEKNAVLSSYNNLFTAYYGLSDYREALSYHILYNNLKDSIIVENSNQVFQLQFNYEKENNLKEVKFLEKQKELMNTQLKHNRTFKYALIFSFFILLALLILSIYAYNQKQKTNKELGQQNDLIMWEKMQSETLLLNILPYDIAEELKNKGKATVRNYEKVTVFFADFKEFSSITEKLIPEKLVAELDYYFIKFDEIINQYYLEKIKTIGDCYMCVGGLPRPNDTNAIEAILAGLEFQKFVEEANKEKVLKNEIPWQLRICIQTGKVIAGVVGKKKFAYDIWGDTVNTASRMESACEPGRVNISGTT